MTKSSNGALWVLPATLASKFLSLCSHFILGWFLSAEEYGLFAIAISISTIVSVVANGGAQQYLIQKGESEYPRLYPKVFRYSLAFNIVGSLALVLAGYFASGFYDEDALFPMLCIVAFSLLAGTLSITLRAKLSSELRFKELSAVMLLSDLTRQLSLIGLAALGFGVFSFVIPIAIEPLVVTALVLFFLRQLPSLRLQDSDGYGEIFRDTRWIMLATLSSAIYRQGQFILISLYLTTELLGIYFFGYQIILSLAVIFVLINQEVVFPSFASISNNIDELKQSYLKGLGISVAAACQIALALFTFAPSLISLFWAGKWDMAAPVVQALSIVLIAMACTNLNLAVLSALGAWKQRLYFLMTLAGADLLVVGVTLQYDDIGLLAFSLACSRLIFSALFTTYIARKLGMNIKRLRGVVLPVALPFTLAIVLCQFASTRLGNVDFLLLSFSINAALFCWYVELGRRRIIPDFGLLARLRIGYK